MKIYYKKNKGDAASNAKLKEAQVILVLNMLKIGLSCAEIGRKFGVHRKTINDIKLKKRWKHVEFDQDSFNAFKLIVMKSRKLGRTNFNIPSTHSQ